MVHLSYFRPPGKSVTSLDKSYLEERPNVDMAERVFRLALDHGVKRVVVALSTVVALDMEDGMALGFREKRLVWRIRVQVEGIAAAAALTDECTQRGHGSIGWDFGHGHLFDARAFGERGAAARAQVLDPISVGPASYQPALSVIRNGRDRR